MRIGFTGTRKGLTAYQKEQIHSVLYTLNDHAIKVNEFHHGDCIGADEQAHSIAVDQDYIICLHPPDKDVLRAFCNTPVPDKLYKPKPYLKRNQDIVESSDILIACPDGPGRQRSGTWSTIRYALKIGVPVLIIMPKKELI